MPEKREEETEAKDVEQQAKAETTESSDAESNDMGAGVDLDLEGLDLTVETVEERISPSETNVFDK